MNVNINVSMNVKGSRGARQDQQIRCLVRLLTTDHVGRFVQYCTVADSGTVQHRLHVAMQSSLSSRSRETHHDCATTIAWRQQSLRRTSTPPHTAVGNRNVSTATDRQREHGNNIPRPEKIATENSNRAIQRARLD